MRLLVLLREARDRLNADLQRYFGVCLTDMYEGRISAIDVSDFAAHLPRGSAVSLWIGGWGALTGAEEGMRRVEYLLQAQLVQASGKRRTVPEPKPPVGLRDAEIKKRRDTADRLRRQQALESMSRILGSDDG